jgi:hypothetical protein
MNANAPLLPIAHFDWAQFRLKLKTTVTSRKFWVMIASLVIIWGAHDLAPLQVTLLNAVQGTIAALGLFSTGVAIEGIGADGLTGLLASQPGRVFKEQVVRIVQAWLLGRGIALDVMAVEQMLEQLVTAAATPPQSK